MTAKPAPVIVDGVPMCNHECAHYSAHERFLSRGGMAIAESFAVCTHVPRRTTGSSSTCLPAIREMHAELVQLRTANEPCRRCGHTLPAHHYYRGAAGCSCVADCDCYDYTREDLEP